MKNIFIVSSVLTLGFCISNAKDIDTRDALLGFGAASTARSLSTPSYARSVSSSLKTGSQLMFSKNVIPPSHLKGEWAETITKRFYLEKHLRKSGNWQSISPRSGRQGLDSIFIKRDSAGRARDLMVGEVKYGSSRLGMTKDGIQAGNRWVNQRLSATASRYLDASQSKPHFQKIGTLSDPRHVVEGRVNGKRFKFWRNSTKEPWKFHGNQADFALAQKRIASDASFLRKSALGEIKYRSKIFQISESSDGLRIHVKNAKLLDKGLSMNSIKGSEIKIPFSKLNTLKSKVALRREIAKRLQVRLGLSNNVSRSLAEGLVKGKTLPSQIGRRSVVLTGAKKMGGAALKMLGPAILVGSMGYTVWQASVGEISSYEAGKDLTSAGAAVAAPVMIYGGIVTCGTASTGTALSALSGAAHTSAVAAWFGGGSLAAGGGGAALGSAVMTGGVIVVAIVVVVAVDIGFEKWDESVRFNYLNEMGQWYFQEGGLEFQSQRKYPDIYANERRLLQIDVDDQHQSSTLTARNLLFE